MASSRSSALPCGTPSTTSINTTSASSLEAIQWAAVAPTLPAPTIETFLRMIPVLLVFLIPEADRQNRGVSDFDPAPIHKRGTLNDGSVQLGMRLAEGSNIFQLHREHT